MHALMRLFSDYTLQNVVLGTLFLGLGSGLVGSFAVLRRQSLFGDAVSHATLPGIVIAFLLTGTKSTEILLLGAALSGLVGTVVMLMVMRTTKIDTDGAQGIVLGVFLGFGFLLLTHVQKSSQAAKAGLNKFILGQAATILQRDVLLIIAMEVVIGLLVLLFWKELKLSTFDRDFSAVQGFSPQLMEFMLTALIVVAVVVGVQAVGVILMSALLTAPAVAARQWTNNLRVLCALAALFGGVSGVSGSVVSAQVPRLSTGPVIVLVLTGIALVSIMLGPQRGVLYQLWRRRRVSLLQEEG
ncbi:iron (Fe2+)/zinc (Zn2+)/manganese (Mn2+) ABC superfamily ATP binding cassette transporter, membrane protein [Treponema paraluiscuniculi Cuniculi A]|uniref:Iron (Fe2+)/zinc (Zn2+)/manganese (Mn2+) ABC superfamily ATP binding cassette transporter, membrane protein n=2 Tax=Treponema paraluiscuniculi TaxID=53435 RepID=F7XRB7_TREPU|nr:transition metal ABC transporter permease subunit TroC [Treponema paraluiscuniculi]AEH40120.1 iron (Fe2+)/zinc (Zn2+)/manganese (Mn2+) ABC superfamily ATP binding cassette transporter, membrane protein [Treponema paraluiscuniculi Cuniculi A]WKC72054.1 iron (Fe2+)/zinc (Zn2+)/manganese (Mn2+) ABC superfamily ATP binding cassette transporter, membrane protein [Treponema paraluiscuniculi]